MGHGKQRPEAKRATQAHVLVSYYRRQRLDNLGTTRMAGKCVEMRKSAPRHYTFLETQHDPPSVNKAKPWPS